MDGFLVVWNVQDWRYLEVNWELLGDDPNTDGAGTYGIVVPKVDVGEWNGADVCDRSVVPVWHCSSGKSEMLLGLPGRSSLKFCPFVSSVDGSGSESKYLGYGKEHLIPKIQSTSHGGLPPSFCLSTWDGSKDDKDDKNDENDIVSLAFDPQIHKDKENNEKKKQSSLVITSSRDGTIKL